MTRLALTERRNTITTVVGRKGSGKSRLLSSVYVREHNRVITLDQTGEARETYPHAIEAFGLKSVYETIGELHFSPFVNSPARRRWHVIAILDPDEAPALFDQLAPPYSSRRPSLSAALGGVCVESGEVDVIAPASGTDRRITNAIARGRHYALSMLFATQRPHQCARMLSSQSDHLVSFAMHEPRDLAWLANAGGQAFARTVRRLPKYWHVRYVSETGALEVFDNEYRRYAGGAGARSIGDGTQLALDGDPD